ncbi:hypothetical protein CASFOL_038247 [Castilleja foliolosa]|uniref:Uncharacterized protein n=1 Tax=Castilleja foliolosa TaxID=1961234 RepID=A0ABD3BLD4_9LAMI
MRDISIIVGKLVELGFGTEKLQMRDILIMDTSYIKEEYVVKLSGIECWKIMKGKEEIIFAGETYNGGCISEAVTDKGTQKQLGKLFKNIDKAEKNLGHLYKNFMNKLSNGHFSASKCIANHPYFWDHDANKCLDMIQHYHHWYERWAIPDKLKEIEDIAKEEPYKSDDYDNWPSKVSRGVVEKMMRGFKIGEHEVDRIKKASKSIVFLIKGIRNLYFHNI